MQTHVMIQTIVNIVLSIALLYAVYGNRVIKWYKSKRKERETQEKTTLKRLIRKEVREYLEELQK